ncbi:MAG: hypothetical protein KIT81_16015 [Alphaproteobacteria bacterium]|nr:hypothetical protein [Alphaproteobacteria bacterium]
MKIRWRAALAAFCLLLAGADARAGEAPGLGPWVVAGHSAARLVATTDGQAWRGPVLAGLHIRLDAGWHTYWRTPGDAGLPPMLDFSGSRNLARYDVLWPVPKRAHESGLETFVYYDEVILPITIEATDRRKPVALRLELLYGVCREICIPEQASLALDLPAAGAVPVPTAAAGLIDRYLAQVPGPAARMGLAPHGPAGEGRLAFSSDRPLAAPFAIVEYPGVFARALEPEFLSADRRRVGYNLESILDRKGPAPRLLLIDGERAAELPLR